jgi:hypothetical protein
MFKVALLSAGVLSQTFTFKPLSEGREEWNFIPYTPEQRTTIAQSMFNLFSIYVNREAKIAYYGQQKPDIDLIPKAQRLMQAAANMTDKEFHYEMSRIVASQRDGHLSYRLPVPHSCNAAYQALEFTLANDNDSLLGKGREKIVVGVVGSATYPELLALSPEASKVQVGDEVIKVNGQDIQAFIRSKLFEWGGSNDFGGSRGVLGRMSVFEGRNTPIVPENEVTYEMKSFTTGQVFTVTLPWVQQTNIACARKAKTLMEEIKTNSVVESFVEPEQPKKEDDYIEFRNDRNDLLEKAFGSVSDRVPLEMKIAEDQVIRYAIYKPESHNMGIISLSSFFPTVITFDRMIDLIRELLVTELKDTSCLLFDVRDNGGGNASVN